MKKAMRTMATIPEPRSVNVLPVVLLGGAEPRRRALSEALAGTLARVARESDLPAKDALQSLLEPECDVLIVDLDRDAQAGLELVETACKLKGTLTVMVYSRQMEQDLLVRCMRAGAREFLSDPLSPAAIAEAIARASARRAELRKKTAGKCLVFAGAKGGSGTTTVASNFAVALIKESGQSVALLDLDLRLGDAALNLGLRSEFSTLDALENESRLDSELVSKFLARHSSGLQVLAAPDEHNDFSPTAAAVGKLVNILLGDFAYLVVDAGTHYNGYGRSLFETADKVYLVTQVSVADLRNAHRFIAAHFPADAGARLEVVLNRFTPRSGDIDEASIRKALTVSPGWKIPSDYQTARQAQNEATALVTKDSAISRVLTAMARAAGGKVEEAKKRRFGLF